MPIQLFRMESVPVREVWSHEEQDFTPWLAEHFSYLNEVLDLDMVVEGIEEQIPGSGRADIVARSGNITAIVENQLGGSDDDHFVRMLHYAARTNAKIVIWVAPGFYPKHREILKWLGESSTIAIYCVEVSTWSIDGLVAPMFRRVVPSDWVDYTVPSDRLPFQTYRDYFSPLIERLREAGLNRATDPAWEKWFTLRWFGTPFPGIYYGLDYMDNGQVWAFLQIHDLSANQPLYDGLLLAKTEIEEEMGEALEWIERRTWRTVGIRKQGPSSNDREMWSANQDWMYDQLTHLRDILTPRLEELGKGVTEFPND